MLQNILHGIARAFTVPAAVRKQVDAIPLADTVKTLLVGSIQTAAAAEIDKVIPDAAAASAAKTEIGALLQAFGLSS